MCILAGCTSEPRHVSSGPPVVVGTVAFGKTEIPVLQNVRCDRSVPPLYPPEARRQGIQGVGIVRVIVDETGGAIDYAVVMSRPTAEFGLAVLKAAKRWKYFPMTGEDGHPFVYALVIPVGFNLGEASPSMGSRSIVPDRESSFESFPKN